MFLEHTRPVNSASWLSLRSLASSSGDAWLMQKTSAVRCPRQRLETFLELGESELARALHEYFGAVDVHCASSAWLPTQPHHTTASIPSFYPSVGGVSRKSSRYHGPGRVVSLLGLASSSLFHLTWAGCCPAVQLWHTIPNGRPRLFGLVSHKTYLHTHLLADSVFRPSVPSCRPPFTLHSSQLQNRVRRLHASEPRRVSGMPMVGFSPQSHNQVLSEDESELDVLVRPTSFLRPMHKYDTEA